MKRGGSMLVATGLRKRFGDILALDGMDLTVAAGQTTGLIGHNGAGKSTFMALAAGLLRPDSGAVTVAGVNPIRQPRRARALLGIAPQELALYPSLTVREHLRVFGRLAGLRGTALRRQIDQTAQAMCLTQVLDRPAGLLSGGQRRRTHTATALLHHPRVLLLDEPTAGADPTTREAVLAHGRVIASGARHDLLAALPGEVVVHLDTPVPPRLVDCHHDRTAQGRLLRIRTRAAPAALGELLRDLGPDAGRLRSVQVRQPTLDDLYRSLASPADQPAHAPRSDAA